MQMAAKQPPKNVKVLAIWRLLSIFRNRGVKSPGILNKEYKEIHEQLKNAFKVSKYEVKALKNRKVFDAFIFYSLPSAMAQSELL